MKSLILTLALIAGTAHASPNELCASWTEFALATKGFLDVGGKPTIDEHLKTMKSKTNREAVFFAINHQHLNEKTFRVFAVAHCLNHVHTR